MGIIDKEGKEKKFSAEEIKKAENDMRGYALISLYCAKAFSSNPKFANE